MREPYIPLFCSITDSTIWSADAETCKVFITLLAKADPEGYVAAAPDGIAATARLPIEVVERALATLMAPDKRSRNKENEGRRVVAVDRGYHVPAIPWFRKLARDEAERARKRQWARENNSGRPLSASATARRTETETETETETQIPEALSESLSEPAAPARDSLAQVRLVFDEWRRVFGHPTAKLDAKRTARIRARLKDFTVEQLIKALAGAAKDDWTMGRDPKSPRKYDGVETVLRDTAQVERFIDLETNGPPTAGYRPTGNASRQVSVGIDPMSFHRKQKADQ